MSEDTPLTALCAICHAGEPRYTCPRCGIHTCGLPCVKLHKVRASCSGVRDPTAYRRRADLATASSIDADFNFITSLERSLARQDNDHAESDSLHLQASGLTKTRQTDSTRLERLVKERGVTWRRAPQGMRRRRENETRVEHSSVTWTVEFMLPDGSRRLCSIPDRSTVSEALLICTTKASSKHLGKRKRGSGRAGTSSEQKKQATDAHGAEQLADVDVAPDDDAGTGTVADDAQHDPVKSTDSATQPTYEDHHVYLLRPNTPAKLKVMKYLQPSDKLADVLNGRTVMEFPTIYIKTEPPDALAAPFVSEERYLDDYGEDVAPIAAAEPATAATEESEEGEVVDEAARKDLKQDAEEVLRALADPSKVLSVLEQDLQS